MNYWAENVGQKHAVQVLETAASGAARELSHAWLITGPPGSGRSNLALRFAAALIAHHPDQRAHVVARVRTGTHPDATVLTTHNVVIGIDRVRAIVADAHFAPAEGRHRVVVIEDADRMPERTSNVLLKALEEPPDRTVWLLCAPSEADLLPTIRSRARSLRLVTPSSHEVAALLHERDGVDEKLAERAARLAQSHIGMARRLATDAEALARRERTVDLALRVQTLGDGMRAAAELLRLAQRDADSLAEELDERERAETMHHLGIAPGAAIPPQLRAQIRALEAEQKRHATRRLRDGIDRVLTDLLSLYRDILMTAICGGLSTINLEHHDRIAALADEWGARRALAAVDAVELARTRLARGVTPGLVLEAMLASVVRVEK